MRYAPCSPGSGPRAAASCVRLQGARHDLPDATHAWLSLEIMLIAPRSCRMSSAAIVSFLMRLSQCDVLVDIPSRDDSHQHVESSSSVLR